MSRDELALDDPIGRESLGGDGVAAPRSTQGWARLGEHWLEHPRAFFIRKNQLMIQLAPRIVVDQQIGRAHV